MSAFHPLRTLGLRRLSAHVCSRIQLCQLLKVVILSARSHCLIRLSESLAHVLRLAEFKQALGLPQSCPKGRWVGHQISDGESIKMLEESVEASGKDMPKPTYGCDYTSLSERLETIHEGAEILDCANHCTDIDVIGISR